MVLERLAKPSVVKSASGFESPVFRQLLYFCDNVKISVDFSQRLCYTCIHELRSCSPFANSEQKKKMLYFYDRHKKSVDKASDPVIIDTVELIVIQ